MPISLKSCFAVLCCLVLVFSYSLSHAQQYNSNNMYSNGSHWRSGFGLELGAGIDVPMHNFGGVYRAAPAFDAGATKRFSKFIVGLHFGYRGYQPKQNSYYIDADDPAYGTISYSNYNIFSVYGSASYDIWLNRHASLRPGINLGSYFTGYSYSIDDQSFTSKAQLNQQFAYVAPRLGIHFDVNEDVQLGIETRYNIFSRSGYTYSSWYGGYISSITYTTWTTAFTLNYKFQ